MLIKALYTRESVSFNGAEETFFTPQKCTMTLEGGFVYCISTRTCVAVPMVNIKSILLDPEDPKVKQLRAAQASAKAEAVKVESAQAQAAKK